jgi:hypothetical protein
LDELLARGKTQGALSGEVVTSSGLSKKELFVVGDLFQQREIP